MLSAIISSKKFGQTELIKMSNQCFLTVFCMQNLKPNILEFFVRPNSKCEIVDYYASLIFKDCDEHPDFTKNYFDAWL